MVVGATGIVREPKSAVVLAFGAWEWFAEVISVALRGRFRARRLGCDAVSSDSGVGMPLMPATVRGS